MKLTNHLLTFIIATVLISCSSISSKEVARIPFNATSNAEQPDWKTTSLDLKAGDKLWFWTDMNVEYTGDLNLEYRIQLIKNSDTVGYIKLHPFEKNITLGEVKTTFFDKTTWSFKGSMDFLQIKETAKYTFRTILIASENESLKINKADLVLKK